MSSRNDQDVLCYGQREGKMQIFLFQAKLSELNLVIDSTDLHLTCISVPRPEKLMEIRTEQMCLNGMGLSSKSTQLDL